MKIKIPGIMNLEQFSERFQIAVAQLEELGVRKIARCNIYLTPVDQKGEEIHLWGGHTKPIKEIEIKPELAENPAKLTVIKKDR
ncbi:protein of unknown function [Nitrospina watsonii]|uniref:Uncharacterized protein n=2 Tax=Nitrospina watsonii TaxID=1323948 RepID=A0ABN8VX83_9BACT|nr:protein of unknown function [Nitrospina watsonii]